MPAEPAPDAPRVLVIEDDPDLCDLLEDALAEDGYLVVAARDGRAALELLDAGEGSGFRPDVILLDLRLPVVDGFEFAAAYRRRPSPHAPIVVAAASTQLADAARRLDPADVVRMPFDLADLLRRCDAARRSRGPPCSGRWSGAPAAAEELVRPTHRRAAGLLAPLRLHCPRGEEAERHPLGR